MGFGASAPKSIAASLTMHSGFRKTSVVGKHFQAGCVLNVSKIVRSSDHLANVHTSTKGRAALVKMLRSILRS